MANLYSPESLGIVIPKGQEGNGNWIAGRQIWNGQLSDPGVINPLSNQVGAGNTVSKEVNAQSAAAQGQSPQQLEAYLQQQRDQQARASVAPTMDVAPGTGGGTSIPGNGMPGAGGAGMGITTPTPLNLPDLYKGLSESAGVSDIEKRLTDKAKGYSDAQLKINDNPFLAEAGRTGRLSKLEMDYNNNIKNDQNELAMKKQDIQTQLDLATKQFDINSQTAKAALDQFNFLLQSGALAGASGNDIAAITAATGISSGQIQAAIKAQQAKDVQTSVTTVDDGKNVYSVVINSKTGQIISKQSIGASKPSSSTTSTAEKTTYYQDALRMDAAKGLTIEQAFQLYTGYLDPNTILYVWNANAKNGPTAASYADLQKFGVKDPTKTPSVLQQLGVQQ